MQVQIGHRMDKAGGSGAVGERWSEVGRRSVRRRSSAGQRSVGGRSGAGQRSDLRPTSDRPPTGARPASDQPPTDQPCLGYNLQISVEGYL